jgi:hypothetical protein
MTHDINRTANCIERLKETIAIADRNDYEMVGIETHVLKKLLLKLRGYETAVKYLRANNKKILREISYLRNRYDKETIYKVLEIIEELT